MANEHKTPSDKLATIDFDQLVADVLHTADMLATPIDFDQLVADGILKKHGAWWQVLDWNRLPEHAQRKARTAKIINTGKKKGAYVQFRKHDKRLRDR